VIAVPGNPLEDLRVLADAFFVMKGGAVVRHDAAPAGQHATALSSPA
jgi:hypothetical protein